MRPGVSRIEPRFVERIWGARDLGPWFPPQSNRTGEVWFQPPGDHPLLVKFLFTTDRLSIQVHPDDLYAREHANSLGKTEMWHILKAGPGASIAMGFKEPLDRSRVRQAIDSGEIENLLNWVPVQGGETYLAAAGCVHAIGPDLALCEIQQNSDVTYRLYDYGRPRELHVDDGLNVADLNPYQGKRNLPLRTDFFCTEELSPLQAGPYAAEQSDHLLIVLEGAGVWDGKPYRPGEVWRVTGGGFVVEPSEPTRLLRTFAPA